MISAQLTIQRTRFSLATTLAQSSDYLGVGKVEGEVEPRADGLRLDRAHEHVVGAQRAPPRPEGTDPSTPPPRAVETFNPSTSKEHRTACLT